MLLSHGKNPYKLKIIWGATSIFLLKQRYSTQIWRFLAILMHTKFNLMKFLERNFGEVDFFFLSKKQKRILN